MYVCDQCGYVADNWRTIKGMKYHLFYYEHAAYRRYKQ